MRPTTLQEYMISEVDCMASIIQFVLENGKIVSQRDIDVLKSVITMAEDLSEMIWNAEIK